jgi:hypothetical protein
MPRQTTSSTREASAVRGRYLQPDAREGQAGPTSEVAERFVVVMKPGNAGGAKGPQFED